MIFLIVAVWSGCAMAQSGASSAQEWIVAIAEINASALSWDEKIDALERLRETYGETLTKKDSIYARIIHRLADCYRMNGDVDVGIQLLQEAVAINKSGSELSEESYLAHSYFNLALYNHVEQQFYVKALSYYDSCLMVTNRYPQKASIAARAYGQKANCFNDLGEFQRAIDISDVGLAYAHALEMDLSQQLVNVLVQKGIAQLNMDRIDEAEKTILTAAEQINSLGMDDKIPVFNVLGRLYEVKGEYERAGEYYRKIYEFGIANQDEQRATEGLNNLALMYGEKMGLPEVALGYYYQALDLVKDKNNNVRKATFLNNIGHLYSNQQDYEKATDFFHQSLNTLVPKFADTSWWHNPSQELIRTNSHLFILLWNKGESLLELYKANPSRRDYLEASLSTFKAADFAMDQMRWNQLTELSKLLWRNKSSKMYEDAIEACYLSGDVEKAFYFFEKSRAVLLNDKLSETGAQKYLESGDMENEQSLKVQSIRLQQKLSTLDNSDPEYRKTTIEWHAAREAYHDFVSSLERKYPNYYQYKYDTAIIGIGELRKEILQEEQAYVTYFMGKKNIFMLAVTADSVILQKAESSGYIEKANELLGLASNKSRLNQEYSRFQELAHELYVWLFQPLGIHHKRLILSLDDHFIPFEFLVKKKDVPESYMVRDHAISYTYSAGFLLKNAKSAASSHSVLGIAPVEYQAQLGQVPLMGADISLKSLQRFFPRIRMLTHEKATKGRFLEYLSEHSIVQLYSHATADSMGTEPAIYFHDDVLNLSELQLLGSLPTQLIVLSACNTGVGKNNRGEGVFSLARGFAAAGIPTSVTTAWQVENQATYSLTESFYKLLSQGLPVDVALQQAKLELADNSDNPYALPYYWAGNILIGKSGVFLPAKSHTSVLFFGGIALVLVVLLYLLRKKSAMGA